MHIATATLDDARAVAQIHVASWRAAYRDILPANLLDSLSVEQRETMWRDCIISGTPELLVAKAQGDIVGWVAFGSSRDEGAPSDGAELWAMYVAPASWATGVGRALWLRAGQRMLEQRFTTVSLWVLAENTRATKFYRAAGFSLDASSVKEIERGGRLVQEVRYARALP